MHIQWFSSTRFASARQDFAQLTILGTIFDMHKTGVNPRALAWGLWD